jgi:hypothetical protein
MICGQAAHPPQASAPPPGIGRIADKYDVQLEQRRVNVDFPVWMIESLDREAARLGVPRQSLIKVWIAEQLEKLAGHA